MQAHVANSRDAEHPDGRFSPYNAVEGLQSLAGKLRGGFNRQDVAGFHVQGDNTRGWFHSAGQAVILTLRAAKLSIFIRCLEKARRMPALRKMQKSLLSSVCR